MPTQPQNPDAGLRRHRLGFVRESEFGVTGSDPEFLKYSRAFSSYNWASSSIIENVASAGTPDPVDQVKGPEEHELTVTYALCKFFTDGSGNANDAAYDGLARTNDNLLPNSHTVVDRMARDRVAAESTWNGSTARPTRFYRVAKGALADEVAVTGDPSDAQPIQVELSYLAQYARPYQVDQPTQAEIDSGGILVAVASDDDNDDSQTVTIEGESGDTSVSLSLNGTTLVTDATTFEDLDAVSLSAETDGNLTVYVNEGDDTSPTQGDALATIYGTGEYDDVEGDLGIPPVGSGSRETVDSLPDYETYIGDRIIQSDTPVPHEIPSATVTVANNVESTERGSGYGMALHPGNREATMEAAMYGERVSQDLLSYHLRNGADDLDWEMTGGTLTLDHAHLSEPGEVVAEEGNAVMTMENTFRGDGVSFSTP